MSDEVELKLVEGDDELARIIVGAEREEVFADGLVVLKSLADRVLDWFLHKYCDGEEGRAGLLLPHEVCVATYGGQYNGFYMTERMKADARVYAMIAKLNVIGLGKWDENVFILATDWLEWLRTF